MTPFLQKLCDGNREHSFRNGFKTTFAEDIEQLTLTTASAIRQELLAKWPEERVAMLNTGEKQLRYDDGYNQARTDFKALLDEVIPPNK